MSLFKKISLIVLANLILIVHLTLVFVVTFGWLVPSLFYAFVLFLLLTILSEIIFGACILSIWEFGIRRELNPERKYDTSCIIHYSRKLWGLEPRVKSEAPRTFFQKYSFILMLLTLLLIGSSFHFFT